MYARNFIKYGITSEYATYVGFKFYTLLLRSAYKLYRKDSTVNAESPFVE